MSFSKEIFFTTAPKGFKVTHLGLPDIPFKEASDRAELEHTRGVNESKAKFTKELSVLREELAERQSSLLSLIQQNAEHVLSELENRLPDLVIGLFDRVLPGVELSRDNVESIVRSLIKEFSDEDESLEVFLSPGDLDLLKGLSDATRQSDASANEQEDGFASAISGIFDNLDGDDSLLPDLPNVRFHGDPSLASGDCQIKSRFGLLDGRIATKLRRVEASMRSNG